MHHIINRQNRPIIILINNFNIVSQIFDFSNTFNVNDMVFRAKPTQIFFSIISWLKKINVIKHKNACFCKLVGV